MYFSRLQKCICKSGRCHVLASRRDPLIPFLHMTSLASSDWCCGPYTTTPMQHCLTEFWDNTLNKMAVIYWSKNMCNSRAHVSQCDCAVCISLLFIVQCALLCSSMQWWMQNAVLLDTKMQQYSSVQRAACSDGCLDGKVVKRGSPSIKGRHCHLPIIISAGWSGWLGCGPEYLGLWSLALPASDDSATRRPSWQSSSQQDYQDDQDDVEDDESIEDDSAQILNSWWVTRLLHHIHWLMHVHGRFHQVTHKECRGGWVSGWMVVGWTTSHQIFLLMMTFDIGEVGVPFEMHSLLSSPLKRMSHPLLGQTS